MAGIPGVATTACVRCRVDVPSGAAFCPHCGTSIAPGPAQGPTLAGYTILQPLGRGGAAVVYLARQESLDRLVAVKLLRCDVTDPRVWRRFQREAQTIARLSAHRNVVTIYTAGRSEADEPYLVTEYLDRGSLADVIAAEGPLSPDLVATVGVSVADALVAAHEIGILHRDVKPGNVLLGHDGRVKLGDFGIARLLGVRSATTDVFAFTPEHVAPEIVRGEPDGPWSDLYGLASTLAAALVGRSLFSRRDDEHVQAMLSRKVTNPPPALPPTVPAALAEPITRALDPDPARRPTLTEFRQQLADAAKALGATVPLPAPTPGTPAATVRVAETPTVVVDHDPPGAVRRARGIWTVLTAVIVGLAAATIAVILAVDDRGDDDASDATSPVVVALTAPDPTVGQAAATTPTASTIAVMPTPTTTPLVVTPVASTAAVSAPPTNPPPDIVAAPPSAAPAPVTAAAPSTSRPTIPPQGGTTLLLTAPAADAFIRSYYDSVAAGDYPTSWAQLAPEFQRGKARSYEYYVGFWDDNDIEVDDVVLIDADAGQATVHVQLRWNGSPTAVTDEFTIRAGERGEPLIARQRTIDGG